MLNIDDITIATNALKEAADAAARDFAAEDIVGEEDFSGQLVGRFKSRIETLKTPHVCWRVAAAITEDDASTVRFSARQTGSQGPGSEEAWSGADLLLILDIRLFDYEVRKGVLVQAKCLEQGKRLRPADALRLKSQCHDMLTLSSASFVFLYAGTGLTVISATAVEGTTRRDLHQLKQFPDSTEVFFSEFFKCWIGDPRLTAPDRRSLIMLRDRYGARSALLIRATQRDME
jgi:hypothetical protein